MDGDQITPTAPTSTPAAPAVPSPQTAPAPRATPPAAPPAAPQAATASPTDYEALAKKYGATYSPPAASVSTQPQAGSRVASVDAPINKTPPGAPVTIAQETNYADLAKKYGAHYTPPPSKAAVGTPYESLANIGQHVTDALTGPGTALAEKFPEHYFRSPVDSFHVIPGSPLEKLIQKIDPSFKGAGTEPSVQMGAKPFVDAASQIDEKTHPMAKAITEIAQSFTSPQMIATMVATGGMGLVESPAALGVANRLIGAGFSAQAVGPAYKNFKQFKEAYDAGDGAHAEYFLTHMIGSGAMAALGAQESATGKTTAENAWTKAGAKADTAVSNAAMTVGNAAKDLANKTVDLIPDKSPNVSPSDHMRIAADKLYQAIKPGKKMVADDFRSTLEDAMPQLSVVANKNPNVKTPVEMADAIEQHRLGIEGQLRQKAFDMRGTPEARMDGIETHVQDALNAAFDGVAGKYTPDEQAKAVESVMKHLGTETKMAKDPNTGEMVPTVNRTGPTPDLYMAENIRKRFNEDAHPAYGDQGKVPSAEAFAKDVAAKVMRNQIDQKFEDEGISGVKEWRKQESALIDVRKALQDAALRSEQAGKMSLWERAIGKKGWGLLPGVVGAAFGGAPGAALAEMGAVGLDWWRDRQASPNIQTQKAIERLKQAGPSADAVIPGPKKIEPLYTYRTRDIGEEGIPAGSHSQATMSEDEAHNYVESRGDVQGKPQEVVRVNVNAVPHTRAVGPNGNDWVKFKGDVPESAVEKVPPRPAPKVKAKTDLGVGTSAAASAATAGVGKKEEKKAAPKEESVPVAEEIAKKTKAAIPDLLDKASKDYGVPASILHAQAHQESGLDPNAVSPKGATGVMQLMPKTSEDLGVDDPTDPEQNIDAGGRYMQQLHKRFGRYDRALAAYNAGPTKVHEAIDKYGDDWLEHLPKETQDYVHKILRNAAK